jgi:Ankyrin repeat
MATYEELINAILEEGTGTVETILSGDPNLAIATDENNTTPLHAAATITAVGIVNTILDTLTSISEEQTVNAQTIDQQETSLYTAAVSTHRTIELTILNYIVDKGFGGPNVSPNAVDIANIDGKTPLWAIALKEHSTNNENIIKDLVNTGGADVNLVGDSEVRDYINEVINP